MTANRSVLLIGGPDAGKSNFVFRIWLAINEGNGCLHKDGLPSDLAYVREGAESLLGGDFAGRTSREVYNRIEIPVVSTSGGQNFHGTLVVPDCHGEEWMKIYRERGWSTKWDEEISESCSCLVLVRVDSEENEPALDWITCERLFGSPDALPNAMKGRLEDVRTPTQVILTDWLQCLRRAFTERVSGAFRPRVGIIISAWDAVPKEQQAAGPAAYITANYPMLAQYIRNNKHLFEFALFGVTIVGGDLKNAPEFREEYQNSEQDPLTRGYVIHTLNGKVEESPDHTLPVAWAMNLSLADIGVDG